MSKFYNTTFQIDKIMSIASSGIVQSFTTNSGIKVNINKNYTDMLKKTNCTCDLCGVKGKLFKIKHNGKKHEGTLVLENENGTTMTIDHNTPKCIGGKNNIDNYIPLCNVCNNVWKNKFDKELLKDVILLTKEDIVK